MARRPSEDVRLYPDAPDGPDVLTTTEVLLLSVWAGLLGGVVQLLWLELVYRRTHPFLGLGVERIWMLPLGSLIVSGAFGIGLLAVAAARGRRAGVRSVLAVNIALGAMGALLYVGGLSHFTTALLAAGLGVQGSRWLSRYAIGLRHLVRRSLLPSCCLIGSLGLALHASPVVAERRALAALPTAGAKAPNIILLILDTVRAADLSVYGYARLTTPALTRLAARGVRFEWAIAPASWTLPSHATIFTGRWPHEHHASWKRALGPQFPTLAELLAGQGYATAGFAANPVVAAESGVGRGFVHYEGEPISVGLLLRSNILFKVLITDPRLQRLFGWCGLPGRTDADDINAAFLRWVDRRPARPFFAFLNYLDAHAPYDPPAPFDTLFGPVLPRQGPLLDPTLQWNAEAVQAERDSYDRSIAYLDDRIGALTAELSRRGLLENTVVIVTADHGEEFREHGSFSHGNNLYLPTVRVPLIISLPSRIPSGVVVRAPVSLRDLPATILELLRVPAAGRLPGRSLARSWTGGNQAESDTVLSEVTPYGSAPEALSGAGDQMRAMTGMPLRYIHNGDGREEVYDYLRDTLERNDLSKPPLADPNLDALRRVIRPAAGPSPSRP